ncbi:MAG: penicillin acylase family protein [Bacteroidota bacterium]|nr:penicillin acylase family protein [Bacteroidota bacterium]
MARRPSHRLGIVFVVLVLFVSGAAVLLFLLNKSLPDTDGEIPIEGLTAPVTVYRDGAGVPHIFAENEEDLYTAAGFVTAQDRLWQMDLMRRYGRGRLAEILGPRALPTDRLMRTIGIGVIADSMAASLSPLTRRLTAAYARGVNACIARMQGRLPLEFDLLQYTPEPWTSEDCLVIDRLIGWELALSWWVDLALADIVDAVGKEKAREAIPLTDPHAPTILPPAPAGRSAEPFRDAVFDAQRLFGMRFSGGGSNCWAITGNRTNTGRPLLANDTHLPHMQPPQWYVMHLHCPGMNVAGVTIPGAPGIVIGHNDALAWGITNAMVDDVDFYRERVSFADSTWEFRGTPRKLLVRVDTIRVRDSTDVLHTVYATAHGPLVNGIHPSRLKPAASPVETPISMRWTGFDPSDEILAVWRINHARSWKEFRDGLATFGVPGQNFTCATRDGTIGYALAARIPLRPAAAAVLPSDGSVGENDWNGTVPFYDLPAFANPQDSIIAHANNPVSHAFPFYISGLWESDERIRRIRMLLESPYPFSARDFRFLQSDVMSIDAAFFRDAFVRALQNMPGRPLAVTRAMNILAQWDCRMTDTSPAAAIYNAAFVRLLQETFLDEMGEKRYDRYVHLSNIPIRALQSMMRDTAATWFDDVRTPRVETRDDILRKAFLLALLDLSKRLGPSMREWAWGKLHTVTFRHLLGIRKPLDRILNVGPYPIGGSAGTINVADYPLAEPFEVFVGPVMRMIVDVSAMDTCSIVLPTGQSGQPFSRHYADQTPLWRNGGYHDLVTDTAAIRRSPWDKLVLVPGEGKTARATHPPR